eukprot:7675030-Pyramimonas_sp.AAC.1
MAAFGNIPQKIRAKLSQYPTATRVSLTGSLVVARDIAHAKLQVRAQTNLSPLTHTSLTARSPPPVVAWLVCPPLSHPTLLAVIGRHRADRTMIGRQERLDRQEGLP